jgi:hypothetical protein
MARKTPEQKLEELNERERKLKAEKQRVKARARKEKRARETRQKVLFGAMVQNYLQANPRNVGGIKSIAKAHLSEEDRALVEEWIDENISSEAEAEDDAQGEGEAGGANQGAITGTG